MDHHLHYLILAISLMFAVYFSYLSILDRRLRNLKRRLDTRDQHPTTS